MQFQTLRTFLKRISCAQGRSQNRGYVKLFDVKACHDLNYVMHLCIHSFFFHKRVEAEINSNFKNILGTWLRVRVEYLFLPICFFNEQYIRMNFFCVFAANSGDFMSRCKPLCSMLCVKLNVTRSWLARHRVHTM